MSASSGQAGMYSLYSAGSSARPLSGLRPCRFNFRTKALFCSPSPQQCSSAQRLCLSQPRPVTRVGQGSWLSQHLLGSGRAHSVSPPLTPLKKHLSKWLICIGVVRPLTWSTWPVMKRTEAPARKTTHLRHVQRRAAAAEQGLVLGAVLARIWLAEPGGGQLFRALPFSV